MSYLDDAIRWANENQPNASLAHRTAFANSVSYLCTGLSGGFGGPSLREHLVSWMVANPQFNTKKLNPGTWEFNDAVEFAASFCFQPAENYKHHLMKIAHDESCFDDDATDLEFVTTGKLSGVKSDGD